MVDGCSVNFTYACKLYFCSDNEEDFSTMHDNRATISIPVKYELGLTFKVDVKWVAVNRHLCIKDTLFTFLFFFLARQVKVSNIIDDDNNNISISFYIGIKRC